MNSHAATLEHAVQESARDAGPDVSWVKGSRHHALKLS